MSVKASPAIKSFVQQLPWLAIAKTSTLRIPGPMRGIYRWAVYFPYQGPEMLNAYACHHMVQTVCGSKSRRPNGLPDIASGTHDDVIKWKHFPRHWPFVRGIHRPPVNSPHKGQWRGAFFDLRLNKRLSKQWLGWWFETPSCPLWRHYNAIVKPKVGLLNDAIWSH